MDAIFQSRDPGTGEKKYPDGTLPYHKFIFEMQLSAPYAGDDKQAGVWGAGCRVWGQGARGKGQEAKGKGQGSRGERQSARGSGKGARGKN